MKTCTRTSFDQPLTKVVKHTTQTCHASSFDQLLTKVVKHTIQTHHVSSFDQPLTKVIKHTITQTCTQTSFDQPPMEVVKQGIPAVIRFLKTFAEASGSGEVSMSGCNLKAFPMAGVFAQVCRLEPVPCVKTFVKTNTSTLHRCVCASMYCTCVCFYECFDARDKLYP
jgi:hypothetical protein